MDLQTKRKIVYEFFIDYRELTNKTHQWYKRAMGPWSSILMFTESYLSKDDSNTILSDVFLHTLLYPHHIHFYSIERINDLYIFVKLLYLNGRIRILGFILRGICKLTQ